MTAIDEQLGRYLGERLGADSWALASFHRSVEGFSWETYALDLEWTARGEDHARGFIVHRVPQAGLLRPYRPDVLFALRQAVAGVDGVPIPDSLWLDAEGVATGRPLYVVDRVAGEVPTQWAAGGLFEDERSRRSIARQLMEITAALHAAPVEIAPAGMRGEPQRDALAEVRHWHEVYTLSASLSLTYNFVHASDVTWQWLNDARAGYAARVRQRFGGFADASRPLAPAIPAPAEHPASEQRDSLVL